MHHWKPRRYCSQRLAIYKAIASFCSLIALITALCGSTHLKAGSSLDDALWHGGPKQRALLQLGQTWSDNGGSWPADFTDLDRALETQRIFRSVVAERNKTAAAFQNPDTAWTNWLKTYNITFNSTTEASYRKTVLNLNLQRAYQLNQLAGPEVAFGLNRFSALTAQEFLDRYTGDLQNDQDITVKPDQPQRVSTPASDYLASLAPTNTDVVNSSAGNDAKSTASATDTGTTNDTALFSTDSSSSSSSMLPGAIQSASVSSAGGGSTSGARRLQQARQRRRRQRDMLTEYWEQWQAGHLQQKQHQQPNFWRRFLAFIGLGDLFMLRHSSSSSRSTQSAVAELLPFDFADRRAYEQQQHHNINSSGYISTSKRQLQQIITPTATSPFAPPAFCSKQVAFPYPYILPFKSVDWLRAHVVTPPKTMTGKCRDSFAYVAAALAESTMLIEGYNGTARDISEAQLLECFPGSSCTEGGSVHVLLNYLACNGVAAVGSSKGPELGTYPSAAVDAGKPGPCAVGKFSPVRTGITGWAFVPGNEYALAQALSKTPIKVSVDASILQSYRAGYLGCNVLSSVANHAILAVGYNYQVRAGAPPPGSGDNFTFFAGPSYWMLKNSWGTLGSVDGYVYVRKGCERGTPLGMMLNRGVMPIRNQTESYLVGRLQCANDTNVNQGCSQDLLLRLSSYCAGVDDYLPSGLINNCSCSCVPT